MNTVLDMGLAANYKSESQRIRITSESWVLRNAHCPICGNALSRANNNARVLDFHCIHCVNQFELKSQSGGFARKITDGAFASMMQRIHDVNSPHFFFLSYDKAYLVTNLLAVPNYFFHPLVIEKRKPLSPSAKRAGWVGCNILFDQIPDVGKIYLVKDGLTIKLEKVRKAWSRTTFLKSQKNVEMRGWTLDILRCIQRIQNKEFSLKQVYEFEDELSARYPNNRFVKDKIRQQLQTLRDKGLLDFVSRGVYRSIED